MGLGVRLFEKLEFADCFIVFVGGLEGKKLLKKVGIFYSFI